MIRNITGGWDATSAMYGLDFSGYLTGAFATGTTGMRAFSGGGGGGTSSFAFDASRVVPTGPENTVKNRAYIPMVKALP